MFGFSDGTAQSSGDREQHDCADHGHRQGTKGSIGADAQHLEDEPADHGTDDADDEVGDQSKAVAAHDESGDPAGDNADDDECENAHVSRTSLDRFYDAALMAKRLFCGIFMCMK